MEPQPLRYLPLLPALSDFSEEERAVDGSPEEDEEFDDEARPHAEDVCEEGEAGATPLILP